MKDICRCSFLELKTLWTWANEGERGMKDTPRCLLCKHQKKKFTRKCTTQIAEGLVAQSRLTLYNPMDYSPPGSSVQGIFQARILEWVAIPFSRGSSWRRNRIQVFRIAGRVFTVWATRKAEAYNLSQLRPWSQTDSFQTPKSRRLIIWQHAKKKKLLTKGG